MSGAPQQVSVVTHVRSWFASLPCVTRATFTVCVGVYLLGLLVGWDDWGPVCLSASALVQKFQLYRVLTALFIHAGVLHVAFNMLAFVPIGCSLERMQGSFLYVVLIVLLAACGALVYTLLCYAALLALGEDKYVRGCAVGLSGVVFGLIVVETAASGVTTRSIFGLLNVPAKLYPWALLVLWQLLMPGVSFFGHLGGVVGGQLFVWGAFQRILPSASSIQAVENWRAMAWLVRLDSYIVNTGGGPVTQALPTSFSAMVGGRPASGGVPPSWFAPPVGGEDRRPGWFTGGWARMPTSAPVEDGQSTPASFPGQGHTLGGSSANAAPAQAAPQALLAAAAEARLARASGSVGDGMAPKAPPGQPRGAAGRSADPN